ncbi:MAG: riboflavin synthase subunit alpha [Pseudomonadales bacterium]|nr:riboflavin synthase subunit alpha [Pseudomonadales bacterium]
MFTGIIQSMLPVKAIAKHEGMANLTMAFPDTLMAGLETGASVAINGVCLTVTTITGQYVTFDAVKETLALSNLQYLIDGSMVNVERSAKHNSEIGGHILSGHVMGLAEVVSVERSENNCRMTFSMPGEWMRYIFNKGFMAINGASLTIANCEKDHFAVNLIPETLARTNFSLLKAQDKVNIEIDAQTQTIVDTVERVLAERHDDREQK